MKKYTTPEIEIVKFEANDVICTSDLGIFTGTDTDVVQSPERFFDDVMGWDLEDL